MLCIDRALPLLLGLLLFSAPLLAAAEQSLDDVLQGFDTPADTDKGSGDSTPLDAVLDGFDDATTETEHGPVDTGQKTWQLNGAISLSSSYNYAHDAPLPGQTDYRGLSRMRSKLNLELETRFRNSWTAYVEGHGYYDAAYRINGRDNYTSDVLNTYERELELGEAWLRGKLNRSTDIKLGRQIVVWGKSDNIRITDIINPLDNREPGMVDIEDLRLPLGMARLDYYVGDWGISALAIPEIRFNKNPPYGSDFYPYPAAMPHESIPGDGGNHTEYAIAANGIFSGWDLSFYLARHYDDTPHRVNTPSGPELQHSRLTMAGFATNVAISNWLLKAEAAHFDGLEYTSVPNKTWQRLDSLLGVEYSGFTDTTLTLEVANRHLSDYNNALLVDGIKQDEWQTALRYQGDFMHARLHLLALATAFGVHHNDGGFARYSAAYDLQDALSLTGGVVCYYRGEKLPFDSVGDNDRLFIDLKYSF